MINAVLLDLDNTMVLFNETEYVTQYFQRLEPRFSDLLSSEELRGRVFRATGELRQNSGAESNRESFLSRFCAGTDLDRIDVWERFMHFYEYDYIDIQVRCAAPSGLGEVLQRLGRSGLKLVLASNPVFPKIAQEIRLGWVDISPHLFDLFTHIGNMSFVKPDPDYYHQICDMLREPPSACLMVGNDPIGDMAAKTAGLKTYRTTDAEAAGYATVTLTDAAGPKIPAVPAPDFTGPLSDLPAVVEHAFDAEPMGGGYRRQSALNGL